MLRGSILVQVGFSLPAAQSGPGSKSELKVMLVRRIFNIYQTDIAVLQYMGIAVVVVRGWDHMMEGGRERETR